MYGRYLWTRVPRGDKSVTNTYGSRNQRTSALPGTSSGRDCRHEREAGAGCVLGTRDFVYPPIFVLILTHKVVFRCDAADHVPL